MLLVLHIRQLIQKKKIIHIYIFFLIKNISLTPSLFTSCWRQCFQLSCVLYVFNNPFKEGTLINVKALRAKFQEEASAAQAAHGRPTIAEKPRRLPPPPGGGGAHCGSLVSSIQATVEGKIPGAPPAVMLRGGSRAHGGTRPTSFPPQVTLPPQPVGRPLTQIVIIISC